MSIDINHYFYHILYLKLFEDYDSNKIFKTHNTSIDSISRTGHTDMQIRYCGDWILIRISFRYYPKTKSCDIYNIIEINNQIITGNMNRYQANILYELNKVCRYYFHEHPEELEYITLLIS